MDIHNYWNVQRVFQMLGRQWGCPIWKVKRMIQEAIDYNWKIMQFDPTAKELWEKYFPDGKPTVEEYIACLGTLHEKGEEMPYFLKDR